MISRVKLKAETKDSIVGKVQKFRKPTDEEWKAYNDAVQTQTRQTNEGDWQTLNRAILEAAETHLTKVDKEQKKHYLSKNTWNKIDQRQKAHEQGDVNRIQQLDTEIRRDARKDRKQHIINKFKHDDADKAKKKLWKAVDDLRKQYKPKYIRLKNQAGGYVTLKERAETIANYLENDHWSNSDGNLPLSYQDVLFNDVVCDIDVFNMEELNILKIGKNRKTTRSGHDTNGTL